MAKELQLTKSHTALVDDEDYERVKDWSWSVTFNPDGRPGKDSVLKKYAVRSEKGKRVYLHRFILNVTGRKRVVDHLNGNGLDCRRSNMRVTTQSENIKRAWRNR